MTEVDDLVQRRPQPIRPPVVARLVCRSAPMAQTELQGITKKPDSGNSNPKKTELIPRFVCKTEYSLSEVQIGVSNPFGFFTDHHPFLP